MVEILDKTKEWSERYGHILKASPTTRFSHLYKGAIGGLEHVISVDNAGSYMELWREGSDAGEQYYATTGAAIKPLPGLAKGARLDEALDRFFVLMAKKGMSRRAQRKAIPKKIKRLAGVRKGDMAGERVGAPKPEVNPWQHEPGGGTGKGSNWPPKKPRVRKNIVEKVDPEIGPSMSVGHDKPSDLSPESSVRKLQKRLIKNVVALTGNQPGSGRVKPRVTDPMKPAKQPVPPKTYRSKEGFSGRRMGKPGQGAQSGAGRGPGRFGKGRKQDNLEGGRVQPGGGTSPVQPRQSGPGVPTGYAPATGATEFSKPQPTYDYSRYRKACPCNEVAKTMKAVTR